MTVELLVPTLGESVVEATVAKWMKSPGESINSDEPLVELETEKVTLEVPSPISGVLKEISAKEGESVEVGALLGIISESNNESPTKNTSLQKNKLFNIKILRLEQIYPFPIKSLQDFISKSPQAEIIWCQEEPENMGSWSFIDRRLEKVLIDCNCKYKRPVYVGRPEAASPATGTMSRHLKEQKLLVNQALGLEKINTASAAE